MSFLFMNLNSVKYSPHRRHDIESFVRTLMCIFLQLKLPEQPKQFDMDSRLNELIQFWNKREENAYTFWKDAFVIVRSKPDQNQGNNQQNPNKLKAIKDHFVEKFQAFKDNMDG